MEYHDFPSKICCLTLPKNFVEEPACVSDKFGYRKIFCIRGRYHDFLSETLCLTVTVLKKFVWEPFLDLEISDFRTLFT